MELRLKVVGNVGVCTMSGAHTHRDTGTLRAAVNHALGHGLSDVVLDFRGVTQIDAEALGELVAVYAAVKRAHGKLILSAVPRRVRYLLAASGLDSVFDVLSSEHQAVTGFRQGEAA